MSIPRGQLCRCGAARGAPHASWGHGSRQRPAVRTRPLARKHRHFVGRARRRSRCVLPACSRCAAGEHGKGSARQLLLTTALREPAVIARCRLGQPHGARNYINHCMNLPHQQRRQSAAQRAWWLSYTVSPPTTTVMRFPTCATETDELTVSCPPCSFYLCNSVSAAEDSTTPRPPPGLASRRGKKDPATPCRRLSRGAFARPRKDGIWAKSLRPLPRALPPCVVVIGDTQRLVPAAPW
jgi:hypothetical protein